MEGMKCSQIRGKLSAFMDGELHGVRFRLIEKHLDGCPECLDYLHELRKVDERVHGLPTIDPSPDFTSRVVSAAKGASSVASRESVSFGSRLKQAVTLLAEAVLELFESGASQSTLTLEEFSDCPPLSMSFIYFNLLGQSGRGWLR
jgi:anti-sigma factor RsiW